MSYQNVSTSIVRRRFHEAGRIAIKKQLKRKQNNVKGLEWAKAHKDWTIQQRNKVLWTDKSKFDVYVWQRVGERAATFCITPTIKHGGGFAPGERQIESDQISQYTAHHIIPSRTQLVVQGFVLMQDNDPKHMSKLCQWNIKSKEKQHVLGWCNQQT